MPQGVRRLGLNPCGELCLCGLRYSISHVWCWSKEQHPWACKKVYRLSTPSLRRSKERWSKVFQKLSCCQCSLKPRGHLQIKCCLNATVSKSNRAKQVARTIVHIPQTWQGHESKEGTWLILTSTKDNQSIPKPAEPFLSASNASSSKLRTVHTEHAEHAESAESGKLRHHFQLFDSDD